MERNIRIAKNTAVLGVIYDENNNVMDSGQYEVIRDVNNILKLHNTQTRKYHYTPKKLFDIGELQPRRIPQNKNHKPLSQEEERKQMRENAEKARKREEDFKKQMRKEMKRQQQQEEDKKNNEKKIVLSDSTALMLVTGETEIINLINAGIKNILIVGPAGCGKTTMVKNVAKSMHKPFLPISCGLGTSPAEFQGYKYPTPRPTEFGKYYRKPSIILLDEFMSLDPSVAQGVNSALANGFINITTSEMPIHRHHDCIIVATSNTFGMGADLQYVANNQLDAATLDRFTGGILKIDYNPKYESQFDKQVVQHVVYIRKCIEKNLLRRIASTRMIIEGERLKNNGFTDWRERMVTNWTQEEIEILNADIEEFKKEEKDKKIEANKMAINIKEIPKDLKQKEDVG